MTSATAFFRLTAQQTREPLAASSCVRDRQMALAWVQPLARFLIDKMISGRMRGERIWPIIDRRWHTNRCGGEPFDRSSSSIMRITQQSNQFTDKRINRFFSNRWLQMRASCSQTEAAADNKPIWDANFNWNSIFFTICTQFFHFAANGPVEIIKQPNGSWLNRRSASRNGTRACEHRSKMEISSATFNEYANWQRNREHPSGGLQDTHHGNLWENELYDNSFIL